MGTKDRGGWCLASVSVRPQADWTLLFGSIKGRKVEIAPSVQKTRKAHPTIHQFPWVRSMWTKSYNTQTWKVLSPYVCTYSLCLAFPLQWCIQGWKQTCPCEVFACESLDCLNRLKMLPFATVGTAWRYVFMLWDTLSCIWYRRMEVLNRALFVGCVCIGKPIHCFDVWTVKTREPGLGEKEGNHLERGDLQRVLKCSWNVILLGFRSRLESSSGFPRINTK